jgi:hypothetical protein
MANDLPHDEAGTAEAVRCKAVEERMWLRALGQASPIAAVKLLHFRELLFQ